MEEEVNTRDRVPFNQLIALDDNSNGSEEDVNDNSLSLEDVDTDDDGQAPLLFGGNQQSSSGGQCWSRCCPSQFNRHGNRRRLWLGRSGATARCSPTALKRYCSRNKEKCCVGGVGLLLLAATIVGFVLYILKSSSSAPKENVVELTTGSKRKIVMGEAVDFAFDTVVKDVTAIAALVYTLSLAFTENAMPVLDANGLSLATNFNLTSGCEPNGVNAIRCDVEGFQQLSQWGFTGIINGTHGADGDLHRDIKAYNKNGILLNQAQANQPLVVIPADKASRCDYTSTPCTGFGLDGDVIPCQPDSQANQGCIEGADTSQILKVILPGFARLQKPFTYGPLSPSTFSADVNQPNGVQLLSPPPPNMSIGVVAKISYDSQIGNGPRKTGEFDIADLTVFSCSSLASSALPISNTDLQVGATYPLPASMFAVSSELPAQYDSFPVTWSATFQINTFAGHPQVAQLSEGGRRVSVNAANASAMQAFFNQYTPHFIVLLKALNDTLSASFGYAGHCVGKIPATTVTDFTAKRPEVMMTGTPANVRGFAGALVPVPPGSFAFPGYQAGDRLDVVVVNNVGNTEGFTLPSGTMDLMKFAALLNEPKSVTFGTVGSYNISVTLQGWRFSVSALPYSVTVLLTTADTCVAPGLSTPAATFLNVSTGQSFNVNLNGFKPSDPYPARPKTVTVNAATCRLQVYPSVCQASVDNHVLNCLAIKNLTAVFNAVYKMSCETPNPVIAVVANFNDCGGMTASASWQLSMNSQQPCDVAFDQPTLLNGRPGSQQIFPLGFRVSGGCGGERTFTAKLSCSDGAVIDSQPNGTDGGTSLSITQFENLRNRNVTVSQPTQLKNPPWTCGLTVVSTGMNRVLTQAKGTIDCTPTLEISASSQPFTCSECYSGNACPTYAILTVFSLSGGGSNTVEAYFSLSNGGFETQQFFPSSVVWDVKDGKLHFEGTVSELNNFMANKVNFQVDESSSSSSLTIRVNFDGCTAPSFTSSATVKMKILDARILRGANDVGFFKPRSEATAVNIERSHQQGKEAREMNP